MKRVARLKPLLATIGICALLAAVSLASVHVESRIAHDHRSADCTACHLLRTFTSADVTAPAPPERPPLFVVAALAPLDGDAATAPASVLGSRAPPAS